MKKNSIYNLNTEPFNHKFTLHNVNPNKSGIWICDKCNVKIFASEWDISYSDAKTTLFKVSVNTDRKVTNYDLTCKEQIIKRLLE